MAALDQTQREALQPFSEVEVVAATWTAQIRPAGPAKLPFGMQGGATSLPRGRATSNLLNVGGCERSDCSIAR